MTPYYEEGGTTLFLGDCRDVMKTLDAGSVDAICTDPPYGLEFMGKEWDKLLAKDRHVDYPSCRSSHGPNAYVAGLAAQEWHLTWALEALRVLRPGGHMVCFGGCRTHHRLWCAVEDAGFEVRDCLMWIYGSGFPKSKNLDGEWQGWGTALKPAWEPILLARKPIERTVAHNVQKHGTGALNIDGCRVEPTGERLGGGAETWTRHSGGWHRPWMDDPEHQAKKAAATTEAVEKASSLGRWPANLMLDEEAAAMLDAQSGRLTSGTGAVKKESGEGWQGSAYGKESREIGTPNVEYGDSGGASRFFYTSKAGPDERGGTKHPTVKPRDLMLWLCKLITPPGGLILDPFIGSGTTAVAARMGGFRCIGIDNNEEYLSHAAERLRLGDEGLCQVNEARKQGSEQMTLFHDSGPAGPEGGKA